MASLSLPRVLQPRKSSLELERENFEKFQLTSIGKAVNSIECPVKEKHVRSAIIGTFHEKGARTFWTCAQRLPLQDNRITAWKFCHVLHKVLREGHPSVIPQSQRHRSMLVDLGKLWCHLKESYGKLIQQYSQLLVVKLDFHRRNPRFPGNLAVTREELDAIGEDDINNYFEMAVEMFDYMDEILALQSAIFGSLDMSRSNSMTSCGQCRLAPLIPCIQDSSLLYDYCVRIMFKLHASLPPDTLSGHRDRFLKQFKELSQFYVSASVLQYFRHLIQIPILPENPPNFLVQSELLGYVTPVVVMPEPDLSEADSSDLVDTSDAGSLSGSVSGELVDLSVPYPVQHTPPHQPQVDERNKLIELLQQEVSRLHLENRSLEERFQDRIIDLETALATKDSELVQEKQLREDLILQSSATDKFEETERRARTFEDKFHKLKEVYSKLREEHIQLLRQKAGLEKDLKVCDQMALFAQAANSLIVSIKADVDKQLTGVQKASEEAERRKEEVEAQLTEMVADHDKAQTLSRKVENLQMELHETRQMAVMDSEKTFKLLLVACVKEAESIVEKSIHEVDNPAISAVTCSPDYFSSLILPLRSSISSLTAAFTDFHFVKSHDKSPMQQFLCGLSRLGHMSADYILLAKAASNTSPDIELGDHMAETCQSFGRAVLELLKSVRNERGKEEVEIRAREIGEKIDELTKLTDSLTGQIKGDSLETVGDMVESELANMDKAIEEAANRIAEILSKSRERDSGLKLEVNEKILDTCTSLMRAIRILVQKARLLQAEIVATGKGSASAKEFYKRNHQWTEGLISAAKAVAMGAKFLLTAADKVVSGQGKLEALIVASQEVAASTAQLVVASRVKASRDSANLSALSQASRGVTQATGQVVATAKDCAQLIEDSEELDVSGLSLHQAKRLEMDCQVKVLELEASLQQERLRLSALRRHHYQLAGDVEGWEIMDKP